MRVLPRPTTTRGAAAVRGVWLVARDASADNALADARRASASSVDRRDDMSADVNANDVVQRTGGSGSLYVVATPIGNLSDLGERAGEVLRSVTLVAAEDTRVSRRLLERVGSRARTTSAHRHNEQRAAADIVERLRAGEDVALVSDAGTPAISDPGSAIVAAAHAAGARVIPIPGPSAVTTLLSASGLGGDAFVFGGFLPARAGERDRRLRELARSATIAQATLVVFEAPHRIAATLAALPAVFGAAREIVLARELTKRFEQVVRMPAGEASTWLAADADRARGEFALAIAAAPAGESDPADAAGGSAYAGRDRASLERLLRRLLEDLPPSRAVRLARELTGVAHRELYALALELARG